MRALMNTTDLAAMLKLDQDSRPVVLDVRWRLAGPPGLGSYQASHIPGAVYLDLDTELAGAPGKNGRHPLPDKDVLQEALRKAGVRIGHPVVIYDDADGSVAARGWWLLRWSGQHEVAVLDGGFARWVAEDRPVTGEIPRPAEGNFVVRPGSMPVVDADQAALLARQGVLLDARAGERYRGEVEPIDARAGHIPGAINAPFSGHIAEEGSWLSPTELATRFARLGVSTDTPVGAYCGSGVTASAVVLALELAGYPGSAALYPGSWSAWAADDQRPVALGEQSG